MAGSFDRAPIAIGGRQSLPTALKSPLAAGLGVHHFLRIASRSRESMRQAQAALRIGGCVGYSSTIRQSVLAKSYCASIDRNYGRRELGANR